MTRSKYCTYYLSYHWDLTECATLQVAAVSGDARRALELCRRAAEITEMRVQPITTSFTTCEAAPASSVPVHQQDSSNEPPESQIACKLIGMSDIEAAIAEMFQAPHIQVWHWYVPQTITNFYTLIRSSVVLCAKATQRIAVSTPSYCWLFPSIHIFRLDTFNVFLIPCIELWFFSAHFEYPVHEKMFQIFQDISCGHGNWTTPDHNGGNNFWEGQRHLL